MIQMHLVNPPHYIVFFEICGVVKISGDYCHLRKFSPKNNSHLRKFHLRKFPAKFCRKIFIWENSHLRKFSAEKILTWEKFQPRKFSAEQVLTWENCRVSFSWKNLTWEYCQRKFLPDKILIWEISHVRKFEKSWLKIWLQNFAGKFLVIWPKSHLTKFQMRFCQTARWC